MLLLPLELFRLCTVGAFQFDMFVGKSIGLGKTINTRMLIFKITTLVIDFIGQMRFWKQLALEIQAMNRYKHNHNLNL